MNGRRLNKNFEKYRPKALAFEESHTNSESGDLDIEGAETREVLNHAARLTRLITGVNPAISNHENRTAIAALRRDIRLAEEESEEGSEKGLEEKPSAESMEAAFARRAREILASVWDSTAPIHKGGRTVREFLRERQDTSEHEEEEEETADGTCHNPKDQELSINPEITGGHAGQNEQTGRGHMGEGYTAAQKDYYGCGSDMTSDGWVPGFSPDEMAKRYGDVATGWQESVGQTSTGRVSAGSVSGTEFGQNRKGEWQQAPASTVQSVSGRWTQASIF